MPELRFRNRVMPQWLADIVPDVQLPLEQLLKGSLYYPSCGRDGDPVRYLGGFVHSFVYVDYGVNRNDLLESLRDPHHRFQGYDIVMIRDVSEQELTPHGWHPVMPTPEDGNPEQYRDHIEKPFAIWCVLQRDRDHDASHGPKRLSLLYVCADGVAAFQALYHGNQCSPEVVAIIQPGIGFGGNWTDFRDPTRVFYRSVMQNPHGVPSYLLYGGWGRDYRPACWADDYPSWIASWRTCDGELGLWNRRKGGS